MVFFLTFFFGELKLLNEVCESATPQKTQEVKEAGVYASLEKKKHTQATRHLEEKKKVRLQV